MVSLGLNLVMTVIGFAVSIMFIVFVCTRLICARIHLRRSRTSVPDDAARSELGIAGSYSIQRGIHGLEPITVSSFPTKKFGDLPFSCGQETQFIDFTTLEVNSWWQNENFPTLPGAQCVLQIIKKRMSCAFSLSAGILSMLLA